MNATAKKYIDKQPATHKEVLTKLHKLLVKEAPQLEIFLQSSGNKTFLAYGKYHYKYASGREGDWFRFAIASWKTGVSFYCCLTDGDGYIMERYANKMKANVGKSCARFKKVEDVDLDVITKVIKDGLKAM